MEDCSNYGWTRISRGETALDEGGLTEPIGLPDCPSSHASFSPGIRVHRGSSVVPIDSRRWGRSSSGPAANKLNRSDHGDIT